MGRRLLPLACVLFLFSLPVLAAPQQQWVDVRSKHFHVVTDAGEKPAHEVALRFEQMRGIFADMFQRTKLNSPVPLDIVAFRSQDGFLPYAPRVNGKPISLDGFLEVAEDEDFIGLDLSSSDPYSSVFRDYAHVMLRANFPVTPLWFEDGFADYFSALTVIGNQVQYGAVPPQYADALANSQWMPIVALFGVQHDSDANAVFHAESWLAVRYLLANNRLADTFKYLELAQIQHVPVADAIKQAFGVDAATFEKNVRESLATPPTRAALPALNDEPYVINKITNLEAQAVLANMHAHSNDYFEQALAEFQAVLKADPNNELASRGIGYWFLRDGQLVAATLNLQKAAAENDYDAQAHYLLAAVMDRKAMKGSTLASDAIGMCRELDRAIQIDPSLSYARDLLAFGLAAQNRFDLAIESEKQAIALDPGAEMYQVNLARLYLKAELWSDADAVLQRLKNSSDPKIRQSASETVAAVTAERDKLAEKKRISAMGVSDPTAPQWKMTPEIKAEDAQPIDDNSAKFDTRKTQYMTGELLSVDCSAKPVAILNVRKGVRVIKLRTDDYNKLLVMGDADSFSCDWRDRKVLINYKPGGKSDGDLVTLELEAAQ